MILHRDEIDVADLDLAAFVLVTVVEALTHAAVLRRPDILSDEKAGRFVDDVTRLLVRRDLTTKRRKNLIGVQPTLTAT